MNFRFSSLLTISFQFHSAQWVVLQYNFEGRYDLVRFIKTVQKVGLYVNLRIGPYVCAEWNFGYMHVANSILISFFLCKIIIAITFLFFDGIGEFLFG